MYWPGITNEIEDMIDNCESCQLYQNKLQQETYVARYTRDKIGTDLFN